MSKDKRSYDVGYGKPPKHARFAKGKSGNPTGRPKGTKNLATIALRESRQLVRVNGPGGSRSVTKLEAAMMQLCNKAAQGDLRSQREFFSLVGNSEDVVNSGASPLTPHEMDKKVMQDILRRMKNISAEVTSTSQESKREES